MHFHMSNLLFEGAVSLLEKPIFLHKMEYMRFFRNVLSLLATEHCPLFIANPFSFEEIAFLETWFICVDLSIYIYTYYSP